VVDSVFQLALVALMVVIARSTIASAAREASRLGLGSRSGVDVPLQQTA
jgi:hypothetical protein